MPSTSGSIQTAGRTPSPFSEKNALPLTFTNDTAGDLLVGQEVYISAINGVSSRTLGTQFPIGTVKVPGKTGEKITVETVFNRDLYAVAKGGTLATGVFVKHDGTVSADGLPNVVAIASGDYAIAIVLAGGTVTSVIHLGVLRSPIKL